MARSKGCLGPTVTRTMRRMGRRRRVSPDDDDDDSWWRTNKLIGGAPGAADDQTVNTETTGTRRQAQQQEEEDDDDDGIDWSKMPPEEVFKRFDTDGSGEIDLEEFKVMLKKLKIQMSSAKAVKYFKMCDVRSRRPAVLRRLHAIDATRVHRTRSWVFSFLISSAFGSSRATAMLHTGAMARRRPVEAVL